MKIKNLLKTLCSVVMSMLMTNAHAVAALDSQVKMISAAEVAEGMNREQAEANVQQFLSRSDVQEQLIKNGLTADEASQRIASLSERELLQLNDQIEQAQAGGILYAILIVVLIIFLIKRI